MILEGIFVYRKTSNISNLEQFTSVPGLY